MKRRAHDFSGEEAKKRAEKLAAEAVKFKAAPSPLPHIFKAQGKKNA
jgi:hypothetical protein